ncbi:cobalamin biosynthesis protein CobD [candidate division KSB3 bacterium]|uniref:Cobalamin biosynthesis protein CobD n=1 Tax=candidate division KSB3 bacterium TaxID=2044937 RepID=A0A2G6KJV5_9BACT|nr:MAG: cobalamin biosynthesis protein CobD [candidate division KSB3 bacterium]
MIDVFCAVLLDFLTGDPPNFPHPIRWMGALIAAEENLVRSYARTDRGGRAGGLLIVLFNLCVAFGVPWLLLRTFRRVSPPTYHVLNVYLLYTCLAARCLRDEAVAVLKALEQGIKGARHRLSYIVGRETSHLNETEILRATVETVAENTADGVIAPLLYAMIGGAPLALAYKMVNTMDSMLGYKNEKYRVLGFFPAKADDFWNYVPARLSGILMNLSCVFRFNVKDGFRIMLRDRKNHKSPNCAYPEGAAAGLLGIQLGGDNVYFGEVVRKPTIGDATRPLECQDIRRTIEIMFRAECLLLLIFLAFRW